MAIKKTKDSPYYSPDSKVYTCPDCGDEFYFKFRDSDKCITCNKEEHEQIKKVLSKYFKEERRKQMLYNKLYQAKQLAKSLRTSKGVPKRRN